jgi:hypothetical protein
LFPSKKNSDEVGPQAREKEIFAIPYPRMTLGVLLWWVMMEVYFVFLQVGKSWEQVVLVGTTESAE